jgi:beta-1,4-mannosyl-glycoprotein beta-1,4-N-acetylglucosaminyltransferase
MKVIDTFMFYNELDVLELRLMVLDKYVDMFVLVESEVTHKGCRKELLFEKNKSRFEKWIPKIKHIIVTEDESPKEKDPWSREKYQRSCILRGLVDVSDDSIVMISDVDEIPDLSTISYSPQTRVVHMWMFEYSMEYMFTGEPWFGTVITDCKSIKSSGPNFFRDNRWKFPVLTYSGWHLTSFGNGEKVALKVNTFAHANDPHELSWIPETFERLIREGLHTDGKTRLLPRPSDVPLPAPMDVLIRLNLCQESRSIV